MPSPTLGDQEVCASCLEGVHCGCNGRNVLRRFCRCPLMLAHGVYPPAVVVERLLAEVADRE